MMRMIDVSSFNAQISNWEEYINWSKNGGQTSGIIVRACEGTAFIDTTFEERAKEAVANGIDEIWYYSYAHPERNSPRAEVDYLWQAVKNVVRQDKDTLMLDMEQNTIQATPSWSIAWLEYANGKVRKLPVFYSYLAYIQEHQYKDYPLIAKYPLGLAAYSGTMPSVPEPWTEALWWQNSDNGNVPGETGQVDTDMQESVETPMETPAQKLSYQVQQAHDVWASTQYNPNTGIHGAWLEKYEAGIVSGPPITGEIHTVDWAGVGIIVQYFASGVRIEWYSSAEHHGYLAASKLW